MPHLVIDTTGEAETMKMALGLVAYQGCLVYAGYFHGCVQVPSPLLYARELSVLGSSHPEHDDYKHAIRMVEEERISIRQLHALASHRCELEEFADCSAVWANPEEKFLWGLVRMGDV